MKRICNYQIEDDGEIAKKTYRIKVKSEENKTRTTHILYGLLRRAVRQRVRGRVRVRARQTRGKSRAVWIPIYLHKTRASNLSSYLFIFYCIQVRNNNKNTAFIVKTYFVHFESTIFIYYVIIIAPIYIITAVIANEMIHMCIHKHIHTPTHIYIFIYK